MRERYQKLKKKTICDDKIKPKPKNNTIVRNTNKTKIYNLYECDKCFSIRHSEEPFKVFKKYATEYDSKI